MAVPTRSTHCGSSAAKNLIYPQKYVAGRYVLYIEAAHQVFKAGPDLRNRACLLRRWRCAPRQGRDGSKQSHCRFFREEYRLIQRVYCSPKLYRARRHHYGKLDPRLAGIVIEKSLLAMPETAIGLLN